MHANLLSWLDTLEEAQLPALAHSAERLTQLARRDSASIPTLASVVEKDPGLTLALLRRTQALKKRRLESRVTTVAHALMLLGLTRAREIAAEVPVLDGYVDDPALRARLLSLYARANHAAVQAYDWAELRLDIEPDEVQLAAQLRGLAELLLWLKAPAQMQEVEARSAGKPEREPAERAVFGFAFDELTAALAQRWGLPELLYDSLSPEHAGSPRVMGIELASQLAYATENGWYNAGITALLERIAAYLHQEFPEAVARVHRTAVAAAHANKAMNAPQAAALLLHPAMPEARPEHVPDPGGHSADPALYRQALQDLEGRPGLDPASVLALTLEAMQQGVGLTRVVFATLSKDHHHLRARQALGDDGDTAFRHFNIALSGDNLFGKLMARPQAIWISPTNHARFAPLLPEDLHRLTGTNEFCAVSAFIGGQPLGLFYADRYGAPRPLDAEAYHQVKQLALAAARAIAKSLS